MNLLVVFGDGSEERMTVSDDIEMLSFIVGGTPKAMRYNDGLVVAYSDSANRRKPNRINVGRQLFGAVAIMRKEDFDNVVHG